LSSRTPLFLDLPSLLFFSAPSRMEGLQGFLFFPPLLTFITSPPTQTHVFDSTVVIFFLHPFFFFVFTGRFSRFVLVQFLSTYPAVFHVSPPRVPLIEGIFFIFSPTPPAVSLRRGSFGWPFVPAQRTAFFLRVVNSTACNPIHFFIPQFCPLIIDSKHGSFLMGPSPPPSFDPVPVPPPRCLPIFFLGFPGCFFFISVTFLVGPPLLFPPWWKNLRILFLLFVPRFSGLPNTRSCPLANHFKRPPTHPSALTLFFGCLFLKKP